MRRKPPFTASPLRVWAVEDTTVQLTWGHLPAGPVRASTGDISIERTDHPGGPGSLVLSGLTPGTTHRIEVHHQRGVESLEATTLAALPGQELSRVATISDLHLGSTRWGFLKTMVDAESHRDEHPTRCARACIKEAIEWGAELLIIKGDAAHHRRVGDYELLGKLVDEFPDLPMILIPGNHDVDDYTDAELPETVGDRKLRYELGVCQQAMPGVDVVAGDSTIVRKPVGTLTRVGDELIEAAREAGGPVLMAIHHSFHFAPVMTHWPPSINRSEALPFVRSLAEANPDVLLTTGHSHRNRARTTSGLTVTEVGSTKDWPGVWAGYTVAEGGIRQVVRRAAADDAITWHEYSRGAVLGLWDLWSPGPLDQRCLNVSWRRPAG